MYLDHMDEKISCKSVFAVLEKKKGVLAYTRRHHPIPREVGISAESQVAALYAHSKTSSIRTIWTILRAYTAPGFNEGWPGSGLYPKGTAGI